MGTLLRRFYEDSLAQASYLVACTRTKQALVIDPHRDVDQYIGAAAAEGLRITRVTETHVHADFVSGLRELTARTGARPCLSDAGPAQWKYRYASVDDAQLLDHGDVIEIGDVRVQVLHTPGHTPEHVSFMTTETSKTAMPLGAFTGDFIFAGDVGRPDLLELAGGASGTMRESAAQLFRSLREFQRFPDHLQLWPGHGAGSPCGKSLSAIPQTTLGYERAVNWAFGITDEREFVDKILEGQPEPPAYFAEMKRVNRDGPVVLGTRPQPRSLDADDLRGALDDGAVVIDTRAADAFASSHIQGTINLPFGKSFLIWAGSVVPYDVPVSIITADENSGAGTAVAKKLSLIGLDDVRGYVTWDSVAGWTSRTHPIKSMRQTTPADLRREISSNDLQIVDVRNGYEWAAGHIAGAENIPLAHLAGRAKELDPKRPVVVHCQMGGRSAVAASVLEARGFRSVTNLAGGYKAWAESGN
jgi:hydroxyacylglutathione hydrolase